MVDIAREAGVARSTVSAILSNSDYCYASKRTRELVHEAAEKLGYQPNYLARGLAGQQTCCIGFVVENIKGPTVHAQKIAAIERAAWTKGYRLLVGSHGLRKDRFTAHVRNFTSQRVDGLIIHNTVGEGHELVDRVIADGVPVVTIDSSMPSRAPDVSFDREHSGYLQAKHLLDLGRRRIVFLIGGGGHHYDLCKMRGHERALREADLDPQTMHWVFAARTLQSDRPRSGMILMKQVLDQQVEFDAVVATSDALAMGAMRELLNSGRRVPDDVAIVGFNNEPIAEALEVPLTTIDHTASITGERAFDLLLDMIEQRGEARRPVPKNVLIPARLVERASTLGRAADPVE